jgi:hypothetical protein
MYIITIFCGVEKQKGSTAERLFDYLNKRYDEEMSLLRLHK